MTVSFEQLYQKPTPQQIKARVAAICVAFTLRVSAWVLGSPSERWLEAISRAIDAFVSGPVTAAIRMMFLDLATDPGDAGDLSADQTPRPGFLSALGEGWYGTTRGGATQATTTVTIQNTGSTPWDPISPNDLTFTTGIAVDPQADGGRPTYRNSPDPSIYTGIGGTISLAPGASITIPIVCEQKGSYGTQGINEITVCTTQSFGTIAVTAAGAALGSDREDRLLYIARCRQASTAASPNGAHDAYRYAATTGRDGKRLQRYDGSGEVGINRVYVSKFSSTGAVDCYYADADGAADAVDVDSAIANTQGTAQGAITNPIGVVPDCVTYSGHAAINTSITVTGTARIKAVPGKDSAALKAEAEAAILLRLSVITFPGFDIGGNDQVLGAGVVYTSDLSGEVKASYPGLYGENLTSPAGATTAILLGHVPVLHPSSAVTVTVVS